MGAVVVCVLAIAGCAKITATSGPGGTINPSGTVLVWKGQSSTFTWQSMPSNVLADLQVDGMPHFLNGATSYTFNNIQTDHTIATTFTSYSTHYRVFNGMYNTSGTPLDGCNVCHSRHNPSGAAGLLNPYGTDIFSKRALGATKYQAIRAVEQVNSDGDSHNNIDEINAGKFPGDPASHP